MGLVCDSNITVYSIESVILLGGDKTFLSLKLKGGKKYKLRYHVREC